MGRREQREREKKELQINRAFFARREEELQCSRSPVTMTLLVQYLYMILYRPLLLKIPPLGVPLAISRHHPVSSAKLN